MRNTPRDLNKKEDTLSDFTALQDQEQNSSSPESKILEIITASWKSQAINAACQLGIADYLENGPRRAEYLAAEIDCHAPSLFRLMRALVSLDILLEQESGYFSLTETGRCLCSHSPDSVCSWAIWWGKYLWPTWENLLYSIKTGQAARKQITGMEGFKHLEADAEMDSIFKQAMNELTRFVGHAVIQAYDFEGTRKIVDVGGGHGELLVAILNAHREIQGVLFEVPHTVEGAREYLMQQGLDTRCEVVGGDFFEHLPGGADVYMLKSVLHNWDNEHCATILRNCRRAMTADSRLLILEQIMPQKIEPSPRNQNISRADLNMLVALGGKERSKIEMQNLLDSQGLQIKQMIPAGDTFTIIEAVPV